MAISLRVRDNMIHCRIFEGIGGGGGRYLVGTIQVSIQLSEMGHLSSLTFISEVD